MPAMRFSFHLIGLPVDLSGVNKVARSRNLKVVEDAVSKIFANRDSLTKS